MKVRPVVGLTFFLYLRVSFGQSLYNGDVLLQYFSFVLIWVLIGVCLVGMWLFLGFSGVIWSVFEMFSGLMIFGRVFVYVTIQKREGYDNRIIVLTAIFAIAELSLASRQLSE